jgi:hypothetical protein
MKADLSNAGWSIPQAKSDRGRGARLLGLAIVLAMAFAAQAQGQFLYRQVALPELAERAPIIVQGRVVEARYEGHPDYPNLSTVLVTLQVERTLRGGAAEHLSFREFLPGLQARMGKRGYLVGQRLLLFLPEPSRYGLSSPLGGEQGRFHIWRDQRGNELVENEFRNAGLFKGLAEAAAQAGVSLSPQQARLAGVARGPVPLEELVSVVKQFASVASTE